MRLASLNLENYRNIAAASLVPGPELTVICGNNGQGKTSVLDAIAWAQDTGVVAGMGDNKFDPNAKVTREQFAQMMYNYAAYKGYDLSAKGDLTQFSDGDSVQEWAVPAMSWANGNALINGHDDGTLEPAGTTTRAQAASILMRFDQNVVEK